MSYLSYLLEKIASQSKENYPFPEDLAKYLEGYVPNQDISLDTYQKNFQSHL